MLGGGADELIEGAHDVGEGQGGAFLTRELDHGEEASFAEFVATLVPGLGDAVINIAAGRFPCRQCQPALECTGKKRAAKSIEPV